MLGSKEACCVFWIIWKVERRQRRPLTFAGFRSENLQRSGGCVCQLVQPAEEESVRPSGNAHKDKTAATATEKSQTHLHQTLHKLVPMNATMTRVCSQDDEKLIVSGEPGILQCARNRRMMTPPPGWSQSLLCKTCRSQPMT